MARKTYSGQPHSMMSNRRADTRRLQAGEKITVAPSRQSRMASNAASLRDMQVGMPSIRRRKSGVPQTQLFSTEVQAVLDRMSALTQTEIDAIEAFVDGLVADGNYEPVTEIYAPCLNAVDFRTGFKLMTLVESPTAPLHTPGEFIDFTTSSRYMLDSQNFSTFANINGFVGAYVVLYDPDVTGNSDLFGVASGVDECYYRWRGNDTNDSNAIYCVTLATPRHVGTVRPTGDFVGFGLDGADVFELQPGAIVEKSARIVEGLPVNVPFQWHGQNIDGTPSVGNVQPSRYSLMMHSNGLLASVVTGSIRGRALQFLRDIGVTGIPAT